jgi:hypothetical protein
MEIALEGDKIDPHFAEELEKEIDFRLQIWSEEEAYMFVSELPEYLASLKEAEAVAV